jgi:threonylcarbamoyladenosine tRNA methylthiotransferase MtaB
MPFFHLPLQAGDDVVLRSMRRGYTTRQFAERVERLVARRPDAGIGTDLLTGHPGEEEAAFERGYRFVESMPFSLLHVFPFSPRPGTLAAASGASAAPADVVRARSARLRALGRAKEAAFRARFAGTRAEILVERKRTREGRLTGLTGNSIRAELPDEIALRNRIVRAVLHEGPRMMVAVPEAA